MIKIITAINNPKINEKIKEDKEIKIISNDIIYQEGIFEILEKYKEIDYIIISKKIYGNIQIEELIKKIKEKNSKIKIILLKENNEKINSKDIYRIVNINIETKNLIKIIKKQKIEEKQKNQKVITIIGTGGIGKSIFSIILAKTISKEEKILIIDFNRNVSSICEQKPKDKINRNIEIKTKPINIQKNYKYIIIDTNILTKKIIENTDIFIFLLGGNIIEIKKAKKQLKKYTNILNQQKIRLVVNKYTENCLDYEVIKNIFSNYKIIGKIEYSKKYDLIINKRVKNISKQIKKQYNPIIKQIKGKEIEKTTFFQKRFRRDNYGIRSTTRTSHIKK